MILLQSRRYRLDEQWRDKEAGPHKERGINTVEAVEDKDAVFGGLELRLSLTQHMELVMDKRIFRYSFRPYRRSDAEIKRNIGKSLEYKR